MRIIARSTSLPLLTPVGSPDSGFRTPLPLEGLPAETERFLREDLGKPELVGMMVLLERDFPSRWAIGGSTAMKMHAIDRDAIGLLHREPKDVDLVMDATTVHPFALKVSDWDDRLKVTWSPHGLPPSLNLTPETRLDFLETSPGRYGDPNSAVLIRGLPVVPLSSLIASKESAIAEIAGEPGSQEAVEAGRADLEVLRALQARPGRAGPAGGAGPSARSFDALPSRPRDSEAEERLSKRLRLLEQAQSYSE